MTNVAFREPASPTWWTAALSSAESRDVGSASDAMAVPEWVTLITETLAAAPDTVVPNTVVSDAPAAGGGAARELARPLRPMLEVTRGRFLAALAPTADVDLDAVWAGVVEWLGGRLTGIAGRTLVHELRLAKDAGELHGENGRARFLDYLDQAGCRANLASLLYGYPVLARLLAARCLRTVEAAAELLDRFAADRPLIVAALLDGQDPGPVRGIEYGRGDMHDGGRTVAVLDFASGVRLVYKPRPLGLHARWNELLGWFGAVRPDLAVRPVRVLPRQGYGWVEFVPAQPCAGAADVDRFYRRQGGLLALLYALDATDIHFENLIACADQPVVVDMETLFHPDWLPETDGGPDPALAALNRSVMRIALLPRMLLGENGSLDVSGLGGDDGVLPAEVPSWVDEGTDTMRLVRRPVPFTGGANRPVLAGRYADPVDHRDTVLAGFRHGYQAIVDHADALLADDGPLAGFGAERIRLVMRNTQAYASMLDAATGPDRMVAGKAREAGFAGLTDPTGHPHHAVLAPAELRALYVDDVPLFTAAAGGRDVLAGTGEVLPGLLHTSGVDLAAAKIRRMGTADLDAQEWLVRATLATRAPHSGHRGSGPVAGRVASVVPDQQRLLALASGIGDDLIARSYQDDERSNWLGLELVDGRHWSVLPMGAGLAEGYCGTALFLAQLGRVTGIARYLEVASRAVRRLPLLVAVLAAHPELAREVGAGYFGVGGICYAVARLSGLLADPSLADLLPEALHALAHADLPGRPDVADGTAGALAATSAVYAETGLSAAATLQTDLADQLRGRTIDLPAGFLWGATGVDWALGRVVRGTEGFGEPESGWCCGAAGVLLAEFADRLPANATDTDTVRGFADRLTGRPPHADLSLCHGQLGRIEPLIELAARGYAPAAAAVPQAATQVLGVLEQYGPVCGTPHDVTTPGLLAGLSGIGYGLLRLGFAEQVPSVLLLRPAGPDVSTTGVRNPVGHRVDHRESITESQSPRVNH